MNSTILVKKLQHQSSVDENDDLGDCAFSHHSLVTSEFPDELATPFRTADEIIEEFDSFFADGNNDDFEFYVSNDYETGEPINISMTESIEILDSMSLQQLNSMLEEYDAFVQDYSSYLVQELAYREELLFEQEQKEIFVTRIHSIDTLIEDSNKNEQHTIHLHDSEEPLLEDDFYSCAENNSNTPMSSSSSNVIVQSAINAANNAAMVLRRRLRRGDDTGNKSMSNGIRRFKKWAFKKSPAKTDSSEIDGFSPTLSHNEQESNSFTTIIPYHRSHVQNGPPVSTLVVYNELLQAILSRSSQLSKLLTDYILNSLFIHISSSVFHLVYAPIDKAALKLPLS
ncbi:Fasciculation and elongation protein zeta 2 (Zygin II) [Cichlidogyrus casuarinus]|uniref:Fasciculation and elongation protein zeta 2 (Zygin II) n=1 Tax=Cichlidogyrus casuarinus TaxID=1844966 RepID=A0ABD2PWB9_9PLAT